MLSALQTRNFRMMAANYVPLARFQVLVGKNAAGKSTFLSVMQFLSSVLQRGVAAAVQEISPNFFDLFAIE